MKEFYAYIRVSTGRQAEEGVSLAEQRFQLEQYAARKGCCIVRWYEEHRTATKPGRPIFGQFLRDLEREHPAGVILHKVDRTARNSHDWADVSTLVERGFHVYIADADLDLSTRAGRMTADMLAVLAADYSRNLSNEATKGMYGRLRQGIAPWPAPLGYRDRGKAQPKVIDARRGALVRQLFESYATGRFSLRTLTKEASKLGLRNRRGARVRMNQLNETLRNPFYVGIIRLRPTGESFPGVHEPLVSMATFQRVQDILNGKGPRLTATHDFTFRRLLTCAHCGRHLIGERQKGRVYYRCQIRGCPTTTVREDVLDGQLLAVLGELRFGAEDRAELQRYVEELCRDETAAHDERRKARELRLAVVRERLSRLTDAYLDGALDKAELEQRKKTLLMERRELEDAMASDQGTSEIAVVASFLELAESAHLLYQQAIPAERRELVEILTSNRAVSGRTCTFTLNSPFNVLMIASQQHNGGPSRDTARTGRANLTDGPSGAVRHTRPVRAIARQLLQQLRRLLVTADNPEINRRVQTILYHDSAPAATNSTSIPKVA
jgi:site-specific DNA recombinase